MREHRNLLCDAASQDRKINYMDSITIGASPHHFEPQPPPPVRRHRARDNRGRSAVDTWGDLIRATGIAAE
jgi:hypothetical protein